MNKPLSILFLIVMLSCKDTPKQIVTQKWDNGRTKILLTYDKSNDSLTYLRQFFYESGKLGTQGHYLNGKQDGLWVWWHENGNKMDEATFAQGFYIGQRRHWYENGALRQVEILSGNCIGECCDGKITDYYDNGQAATEGKILNGVKDGKYTEWHSNGVKGVEGFYKQDKQDSIWTWFDSTGKVETSQLYRNGELVRSLK